jgi:hypothetical protein
MRNRRPHRPPLPAILLGALGALGGWSLTAAVEETPPPATAPAAAPAASPAQGTVGIGVTLFTDYTYTREPTSLDADGNEIHPASFNVSRAYINVKGDLTRQVSFRITPDITRLTSTTTTSGLGPGESVAVSSSADGSLTFRLKYAFGEYRLDDAWGKGSWVRFGLQQTPYIAWMEDSVYRYRFQGPLFADREGFLSSSDFGLSARYVLPGDRGDLHAGYFNGETYAKADPNDQKSFQARGTLRLFPRAGVLQGLKLTAFYDSDRYVDRDPRNRFLYALTLEHRFLDFGYEHLDARDRATAVSAEVKSRGYSIWATPRTGFGLEGLLRYDVLHPDTTSTAAKQRVVAGIAYWFKTPRAPLAAALMLDYDAVTYDASLGSPDETRYGVHALINY